MVAHVKDLMSTFDNYFRQFPAKDKEVIEKQKVGNKNTFKKIRVGLTTGGTEITRR